VESLEARLRDQQQSGGGEESDAGGAPREGERSGEGERGEEGQQPGSERSSERLAQGERGQETGEQPGGSRGRREGEESGEEVRAEGTSAARGGMTQIGGGRTSGSFQPGLFGTEDLRQIERELRERAGQGQELRDQLRQQGVDTAELDSVLDRMRRFNVRRINNDPLALDQLRREVVEGLRQFEYRLWRELEGGGGQLHLTSSDQVPPGYREMVEEYFRRLSAGGSR
jgi:hypothetical protein